MSDQALHVLALIGLVGLLAFLVVALVWEHRRTSSKDSSISYAPYKFALPAI
jgi:hypothetical protein